MLPLLIRLSRNKVCTDWEKPGNLKTFHKSPVNVGDFWKYASKLEKFI